MQNKQISINSFSSLREKFRKENKSVVLCHGVFDLVHYGHVEHLREAKSFGDILVVSVTAARFVNKGPGRPYFSDEQRINFIASLEMVDYVILSEAVIVDKIVEAVQPDIYVKGQEYAKAENDITGNIGTEAELVERYGGIVRYTNGVVFSSTKLINNNLSALPQGVLEVARDLKKRCSIDQIRADVERFRNLKVLLVGDIIIDEYRFCEVQGLMSKNTALSARYEHGEAYPGGVLAVARHLAEYSDHVTLLSVMGQEEAMTMPLMEQLREKVKVEVINEPGLQTVIKQRYLEKNGKRDEYNKLFSVNYLPTEEQWKATKRTIFYDKLRALCRENDVVMVTDYGQGLLDQESLDIVQRESKYLALNCQTNSSNYGYNLITKYSNANTFTLDEKEIRLAFSAPTADRIKLLVRMKKLLKASSGWLTIGADGALGIDEQDSITHIPALTLSTTDTIGAGDAFYSLAALCAASGVTTEVGTLLGNIAGAIKAHLIGNSKPVDKVSLLKYAATILNV